MFVSNPLGSLLKTYWIAEIYNITGKWFLPNPAASVFYLHFRDRISWIEADAVCQFHHAQLVTVNSVVQFSDLKSYLQVLPYDEAVWIGLRRSSPQGPFKWTDDSALLAQQYWKTKPTKDAKLCVESSPGDDFLWTAHQCNGPEVAAFVCEIPVPKWVRKSSCMESIDSSITVTFHPDKSMLKAGTICQNSDVKYIECHESGKEEKPKENMKQHLNCASETMKREQNTTDVRVTSPRPSILKSEATATSTTTNAPLLAEQKITSRVTPYTTKLTASPQFVHSSFRPKPTSPDQYVTNSKIIMVETTSEAPSTMPLPREMSFAEEPIKASKPFLVKDPTEQSVISNFSKLPNLESRPNPNVLNLIPTSVSEKSPFDKASHMVSTDLYKDNGPTTSEPIPNTTSHHYNATPLEESHEIFNSDKDQQGLASDLNSTKRSILAEDRTATVVNSSSTVKNILAKQSESEEDGGDRTYNIEGTFDVNDFQVNPSPINLHKKIDLAPLSKNAAPSIDSILNTTFNPSSELVTPVLKITSQSPAKSQSITIVVPRNEVKMNITTATTSMKKSESLKTTQRSVQVLNSTLESTEKPEMWQQRISSVLSGAEDSNARNNPQSRKRRVVHSERQSFYPYFLGRILG